MNPDRRRKRENVLVEATTSANYRWFRQHVVAGPKPIAIHKWTGFTVLREEKWSQALAAAEAKEIPND
jgi:hypothetical protein